LQLKFALIIRRRIGQVKWMLTDNTHGVHT
jgi:hypothetical protein